MEINGVKFALLSPEKILSFSVCEIKYDKIKKSDDNSGTPADPRLGTLDETPCETCKCDVHKCPGHFGHIVLAKPIIHPLDRFPQITANLLSCFCTHCNRILLNREMLLIEKITRLSRSEKLDAIISLCNKLAVCCHCNQKTLKYKLDASSGRAKIFSQMKSLGGAEEAPVEIPVDKIYQIFSAVHDEDLKLMGIEPSQFHPKNLILRVLPVLPLRTMPYIVTDNEKREDDLMTFYRNILKVNNRILSGTYADLDKEINSLVFYISNFMDNSKKKVRQPNGRAHKSIRDLLSSKKGLLRSTLLGKRVHWASRTVIGGDPTLATDEIFLPQCIVSIVTIPETVTPFSRSKLEALLEKGEINFITRIDSKTNEKRTINPRIVSKTQGTLLLPGDRVFRTSPSSLRNDMQKKTLKNGTVVEVYEVKLTKSSELKNGDLILRKTLKNGVLTEEEILAETPKKRSFQLQDGDIAHRWVQNGDWVMVNRQPSLHAQSMIALKAKRSNQKMGKYSFEERSIRLPPDIISPLNADFDGDESNVHNPQNLMAKAEYRTLISIENNVIANQSSRPLIGLVQDALLGCWKMTQGWVPIEVDCFNDIIVAANIDLIRLQQVEEVYEKIFNDGKKYLYTGRGLLSAALPVTFNYFSKNKGYKSEPLEIRHGVILSGGYNKSAVGNKNGAIHHFLSGKETIAFLTKTHTIAYNWVRQHNIGVGFSDCIPPISDEYGMIPEARNFIEQSYLKAHISEEITHGSIAEIKVRRALNNARSVGQSIAMNLIPDSNRIKQMIEAGSKGSINNLTQIMVAIGQNTVNGGRMALNNLDGERSLPHYVADEKDLATRYQSRGFITNSFFNGLTPLEFFFHAQPGREGIISTSIGTQKFGYLQRKLTEALKNIIIAQDYTVRNCGTNQIISFFYGGTGFAPSKQYRDKSDLFVDISTVIDQITIEYEMRHCKHRDSIFFSIQRSQENHENHENDNQSVGSDQSDAEDSVSEDSISEGSVENDFDDF